MNRLLGTLTQYIAVICVALVLGVVILMALNPLAKWYVARHPEVLMSSADRINQQTRAVKVNLIPREKITTWYDLKNPGQLSEMWEEYYNAGAVFQSYVHFRSRAVVGNYYGMTEHGFRLVKNNGPWPLDANNFNIFFFGGSTSFGVGPYWATVASYLQEALDADGVFEKPVKVYNFGRSGYQSTQEGILFNLLLSNGARPDMVVFLDGLNDFCFVDGQPSGWQALQRFFNETNASYQRRMAGYGVATDWIKMREFAASMPVVRLATTWFLRLEEPPVPEYAGVQNTADEQPEKPEILGKVIDRYLTNTSQIAAVADAFGVLPVFVIQPIPTYNYDASYHLFFPNRLGCHINSKHGYPILRGALYQGKNEENYVWAADIQKDATENLYIDAFHYTAPMSQRIARFIAGEIISLSRAQAGRN